MWDCKQKASPKKELSYRQEGHTQMASCIQNPRIWERLIREAHHLPQKEMRQVLDRRQEPQLLSKPY